MSAPETSGGGVDLRERIALVELVDRVLNKGVVLTGDVTLSVAGVDLVYLGLRVLLTSVASLEQEIEREEVAA
jgi:gas vesicle structural protein